MLHRLFNELVTLVVVIYPVGVVPLFIAVTARETPEQRRRIAWQAIVIAAVVLLVAIGIGQALLDALGVQIASFQVAGGLVLLIIALRMVLKETNELPPPADPRRGNPAVFPIAMPFIAGPAALMAVVLLTDNAIHPITEQITTGALLLAVLLFTYGCLIGAEQLLRLLGDTGINVLGRVMGLILAALAVQAIANGVVAIVTPHVTQG